MTDHDALYRSTLAHPGDDTPRLVYADWLEENGQPEQAEFIRAECRLEATTPDDPEYTDLLDRREELRLWLTARMPGPSLHFPAGLEIVDAEKWWEWTFRGFPRFLEFEGHGRRGLKAIRLLVAALEQAFTRLPTRWLVVRFITVDQLGELLRQPVIAQLDQLTVQLDQSAEAGNTAARLVADCSRLSNLRGVSLAFTIGDAGAEALAHAAHLRGLQWLSLEPSALTPAAIRTLAGAEWFARLRELSLTDGLPDDCFQQLCLCDPFLALHTLNLSDNSFSVASWQAFARSKAFPALCRLNLIHGDLSNGRFAALAGATDLQLAAIDLTACAIGNAGAKELVAAPWAGSLRQLDLRYNDLGPSGVAVIGNCPHFTRLRHLDLGYNQLGASGLRAIATNPALRGLTSLQLYCHPQQNSRIDPEHFERFLSRLQMPNLRHLNLSGCSLGLAAQQLTAAKFASLTRLELADSHLTNAVAQVLLTAPTLQNLIELDLSHNRLKTGLKPLTDPGTMPRLSRCLVTGRNLPADLVRKLKRRPGVYV